MGKLMKKRLNTNESFFILHNIYYLFATFLYQQESNVKKLS